MSFYDLNADQQRAYNLLMPVISGRHGLSATLQGYAGTGKTTLAACMVRALREQDHTVLVTAPTHKALGVLQERIGDGPTYMTIHAALGLKLVNQQDGSGKLVRHKAPVLAEYDVTVVDEASMLGADLFAPAMAACQTYGTGLLFIGDPAQLPPVTPNAPAALSPAFGPLVPVHARLDRIVRQAQDNPILRWSETLREAIERDAPPDIGVLADQLRRGDERLCQIVHGDDDLIARWAADAYAHGHDMRVLTYTNAAAVRHNRAVHARLFPGGAPFESGEPLIAADGDIDLPHGGRLSNGQLLVVDGVEPGAVQVEGFEAREVHLRSDGGWAGRALLAVQPDAVQAEIAARFARVRRAKAEGKEDEAGRWSRSAYALKAALPDIRHAYAMTIHKSQGSTFDTVLVDWREAQKARMAGADLSRLLYVAITRASQHCVIVT
ncbi:AAA family ATPase [Tepidimonas taiwanensis]|uniref:ATP-dependent RecD-like DNA helicase n=1 Tax=Tepidimonas taiwanensis TaxID=307486 RepID=A0A554XB38_9BURK|nr:AAA family ATPase [Tepidimonas taiwanensis]TSE32989.1 ATP-dependent RecD-like DNA helicase [Tepidimonas taiwanensis]UBQ04475.1 AAA family ATPase [Tepidimonas taiwanensis]